jgi:hypothetical protein
LLVDLLEHQQYAFDGVNEKGDSSMDAGAGDMCFLEAAALARLIRDRELSSVEVTQAQLARIARIDADLRSFAIVMEESALAEAATADAELAAGCLRGPASRRAARYQGSMLGGRLSDCCRHDRPSRFHSDRRRDCG